MTLNWLKEIKRDNIISKLMAVELTWSHDCASICLALAPKYGKGDKNKICVKTITLFSNKMNNLRRSKRAQIVYDKISVWKRYNCIQKTRFFKEHQAFFEGNIHRRYVFFHSDLIAIFTVIQNYNGRDRDPPTLPFIEQNHVLLREFYRTDSHIQEKHVYG